MKSPSLLIGLLVAAAVWMALGVEANNVSIADWGADEFEDGARCDVGVLHRANREHLHLILEELVNTTFFRLFRVGLDGDCPIFQDPPSPSSPTESSCSVSSIPILTTTTPKDTTTTSTGQCSVQFSPEQQQAAPSWMYNKQPVDRTISSQEKSSLNVDDLSSCETPDFWFDLCDGLLNNESTSGWVNLQLNPERHTGYNGSKVWAQIYKQVCFSVGGGEKQQQEERVLHRMLSGVHASINTHISLYYSPPERPGLPWAPNATRFMQSVGEHPDRLRNLNFAFVVLLRALKKAAPVLSSYSYAVSEDEFENERTGQLVRRLLDSHLMSSCAQVFDSFDESSMFQNKSNNSQLKVQFKQAFRSVSETFNCIRCQKCRLHGKMQLTGLGTALKILLLPEVSKADLKREEVVALFNTLHKLSHSIDSIDRLTELYLEKWVPQPSVPVEPATVVAVPPLPPTPVSMENVLDVVVGAVARAFYAKQFTQEEESALLEMAMQANNVMLGPLAKHYGHDTQKFALHAKRFVLQQLPVSNDGTIVVVGSGLAGSTCVLHLLDGGVKRVILIEKQPLLGGNSVYASSGMNAPVFGADSPDEFAEDMARSSGRGEQFERNPLVQTLVHGAGEALEWVRTRAKVDFSQLGKLGGHTFPRTWRPLRGLAGSELLQAIHHAFQRYIDSGRLRVWKSTRVVDISNKLAIKIQSNGTEEWLTEHVSTVVFATGGFAANNTLVPFGLREFKTTNMAGATGDAVGMLKRLGAKFTDMDLVQLHPTAFVVDSEQQQQQPLCAEIMRGVGGILLNSHGKRFCNELGTRAYVSTQMRLQDDTTGFTILLSEEQAARAGVFPKMYVKKGLLHELHTLDEVARYVGVDSIEATLQKYAQHEEVDEFGKTEFANSSSLLSSSKYYVGRVRPALHYCMGGVSINQFGQVLREGGDSVLMDGLFAVGEVSGGLHGDNRLGGNGMTEALVFGSRVAETILAAKPNRDDGSAATEKQQEPKLLKKFTLDQLTLHKADMWTAIYGKVYDFSSFAANHPGGEQVIRDIAGRDGTDTFEEIHTASLLGDFQPIGELI